MEGLLQRTMFELPSMTGVVGCQVDAAAVGGEGPIRWERDGEIEETLAAGTG